jgi:hypothetical protein
MNERTYGLFIGGNLAASTGDAATAFGWMASSADDPPNPDVAVIVFDGAGMPLVALVDARTQG